MKNIWIIEDDEDMVGAIQLMLKMLKHESIYFIGARPAAQALLTGKRPDLIILDILMPEVSGVDFLAYLRSREEYKDIPVVVLSTQTKDFVVDKALGMGADSYVTKPVTLDELDQAMQRACKIHGVEA